MKVAKRLQRENENAGLTDEEIAARMQAKEMDRMRKEQERE